MQKLKHEPAYYETTKFKWRQRIGFGISDYACNLAYLLANTYLLFYYTNCAALATGYRNTNIVLGIIVIIIMAICVFSIVEINPPTQSAGKSSLIKDIGNLVKNKYYIMFLGEVFFLFLGYLGMYGAMQYYYTYIVGDVSGMSLALTLLTLLAIPTMVLAAYLNGKGIAKIKLIQFGAIVDVIGYLILFFTSNGTVATASLGLIGLGFGFRSSMFFSMMPDIFDYTEWQVGRNLGGTQNAIQGFVNKLSSAAASAIVSALLVWGNYDAAKLDKAIADGVDIATKFPQTHTAINFAFGGLSLISTILAIVVLLPYDLDKKYPQIRADLDKRQNKNA